MSYQDHSPKRIPIGDLHVEPELLDTAAMEPYLSLAMAKMGGKDRGIITKREV